MSDVKQVVAVVNNPSPHDPDDLGRATVGYYVIEDKLLTMTHGDGRPFIGRSGETITQKLQRGDDPSVIAKRLTLRIHRSSYGDRMADFHTRRLVYPRSGVA